MQVCMQLWQACMCMRWAWISLDHSCFVSVGLCFCIQWLTCSWNSGWGDSMLFPMKHYLLLGDHLEKLSVNCPMTQKASLLKTCTIGSKALDALFPLSSFHCAMTRTNCIQRPLHKKILGALGFWWWSSFCGSLGRRKMGENALVCLVEAEVNWQSMTLVFLDPVTFSQESSKQERLDSASLG